MASTARRLALVAVAAAAGVFASIPSYAQAPAAPSSQTTKPISASELQKLVVLGAINTCSLAQDKVNFDTAIKANVTSIGSLIANLHGRQIQGVNDGKPLSGEQLSQGLANQIAVFTADRCPNAVPEKVLSEIKKALSSRQGSNSDKPSVPK